MIKINLLPKGLYEKKIVRNLAVTFAVIAMMVAGGGVGYRMKLAADIGRMTAEVEAIEARQKMVQGLKANVQQEAAKLVPIHAKVKFIEDVFAHNEKWPKLYEELAKYTYKKVLYRRLTPSENGLQIEAHTTSISDAGRFLLNMYRANDIFSSVTISGLPGYPRERSDTALAGAMGMIPMGEPQQTGPLPTGVSPHLYRYGGMEAVSTGVARAAAEALSGLNFTVTCTLREQITAPALPGLAPTEPGMGGFVDQSMPMQMPSQQPGAAPGTPSMTMPSDDFVPS
jgi:hypothetical protein